MNVYRDKTARMIEVGTFRLIVERVRSNGWASSGATALRFALMWRDATDGVDLIIDRAEREVQVFWPCFAK